MIETTVALNMREPAVSITGKKSKNILKFFKNIFT